MLLYIFEQYENKEIEIKLEYSNQLNQFDTYNPCSNYSLIYINSNFTYSAKKSDIVKNKNYVNSSLSCYTERKYNPSYSPSYYYITTKYKIGKINSPSLYKYNVIGIKIQTLFETGLYYFGVSEIKEKKEEEKSFFSKYGLIICVIIIIVNLILIGIGKALRKKKIDQKENNDNSQNLGLLPQ